MTTTAERQFTVGEAIISREQWETLPLGTTLTYANRGGVGYWRIAEHDGYHFLFENDTPMHRVETTRTDGVFTIASLPEPERPPVETRITSREMYQALPIGATIRTPSGAVWTKESEEFFRSNRTERTRRVDDFSTTRGNVIRSYPDTPPAVFSMEGDGGEGVECVALSSETLAQYKQRFETTLWGLTQSHGTRVEATEGAMHRLDVPSSAENPRPGMVVRYGSDIRLLRALPVGTMLTHGPDSAPVVFEKRADASGRLARLVGPEPEDERLLVIRSMPGVEPIDWAAEATDDEEDRVHAFMRRAWEVGMAVKRAQSWCGTFESCMLQVGISAATVERARTLLSVEQVAALPPGSILRLARGDHSLLVIRDDAMTNPARTRRVAGTVEGDWTRQPVEHVHDVTGPLWIRAFSHAEMNAMPTGTAISYDRTRVTRWAVKQDDGLWNHGRGAYTYRPVDLDVNSVRYVGFPFAVPIRGGLSATA